jgi:hypothetical protein
MEIMGSVYLKEKKSLVLVCEEQKNLENSRVSLSDKNSQRSLSKSRNSPGKSPRSISNIALKLNSSSSSSSLFPGMKT